MTAAPINRIVAPTRSIQPELPLDLPSSIPLVPAEVARVLLALPDPDHVAEAVEVGRIRWAFNICTPDAERGELRIYREALLDAVRDKARIENWAYWIPRDRYDHFAHLPQILSACLPPGSKPFFALASLARCWACSPQHIQNLIDAGCLVAVATAQMGPNGSALIGRDSAEAFLTSRCESIANKKQRRNTP